MPTNGKFSSISKNISFNFYYFYYLHNNIKKDSYYRHISHQFSKDFLTDISKSVCKEIKAKIVNISDYDFVPHGNSMNFLLADGRFNVKDINTMVHLDKSHIAIHTYPDNPLTNHINIFRIDYDISTCGSIVPLQSLNFMIENLKPDIVQIDYKVRGLTWDASGNRIYFDHDLKGIDPYLNPSIKKRYEVREIVLNKEKTIMAKLKLIKPDIESHIINFDSVADLPAWNISAASDELGMEINDVYNSLF
jgi:S-adenosylmethionine decarboxylase